MIVVLLAVVSLGFRSIPAGADEAWVNNFNYSFRSIEVPPGISVTAEMTTAVNAVTGEEEPGFLMTIKGMDKFTAYLRLNLPTGTFLGASPSGGPQAIATQHGYIDAGKFNKNSLDEWSISLPKTVLCSATLSSFFPSIMLYDDENPSRQTEVQLWPGSSYFKLGAGLKTDIVNHGMAMTVNCQ